MDEHRLARIEIKLDDLAEHLGSIDVTLAKQHESLKMHMRRSDMLEKQVEVLKKVAYMAIGAWMIIEVLIKK
jgi:hypothetical protein